MECPHWAPPSGGFRGGAIPTLRVSGTAPAAHADEDVGHLIVRRRDPQILRHTRGEGIAPEHGRGRGRGPTLFEG